MVFHLAEIINRSLIPVARETSSKRRWQLALVMLVSISLIDCRMTQHSETQSPSQKQVPNESSNDPLTIHRRAIAVDMHADTTQRLLDENVDLSQRLADGHFDSVRAREGGL